MFTMTKETSKSEKLDRLERRITELEYKDRWDRDRLEQLGVHSNKLANRVAVLEALVVTLSRQLTMDGRGTCEQDDYLHNRFESLCLGLRDELPPELGSLSMYERECAARLQRKIRPIDFGEFLKQISQEN